MQPVPENVLDLVQPPVPEATAQLRLQALEVMANTNRTLADGSEWTPEMMDVTTLPQLFKQFYKCWGNPRPAVPRRILGGLGARVQHTLLGVLTVVVAYTGCSLSNLARPR